MANPKDNHPIKEQSSKSAETVKPMEAPNGLDLHPEPRRTVRISRRAGMAILLSAIGLLLAFAYGGYRRTTKAQTAARDAGMPKNASPATQAGSEFTKSIPDGTAPLARTNVAELQPPDTTTSEKAISPCGSTPQTGQPFRFNPQTGQPCDGLPQERLIIRQPPISSLQPPAPAVTAHEPTPEERRLATAYAREQEARMAPTSIHASAGSAPSPTLMSNGNSNTDDLARGAALAQAVLHRSGDNTSNSANGPLSGAENEYEGQNMQSRKESFLSASREPPADDYLRSTRDAPISRFEIRAGWEIPAVLEQSLRSDLPGELKALVTLGDTQNRPMRDS